VKASRATPRMADHGVEAESMAGRSVAAETGSRRWKPLSIEDIYSREKIKSKPTRSSSPPTLEDQGTLVG